MNEMRPRHITIDAVPAVPWRNGGGVTRELARSPASTSQEWAWRVSIAEIDRSGPFSAFDGYTRLQVLLAGRDLTLQFADGERTRLAQPGDSCHYDGGRPLDASLGEGPCRALNLIAAPWAGLVWEIEVISAPVVREITWAMLVPLTGAWVTACGMLAPGDVALYEETTAAAPACAGAESPAGMMQTHPADTLPDSARARAILLQATRA